ncbi:MAG: hypothetical protein ACO3JL_10610 [Myxococcota bacterium]
MTFGKARISQPLRHMVRPAQHEPVEPQPAKAEAKNPAPPPLDQVSQGVAAAAQRIAPEPGLTLDAVAQASEDLLTAAGTLQVVARQSMAAEAEADRFQGASAGAGPLTAPERAHGKVPGVLGRALAGFGEALSLLAHGGGDGHIAAHGGYAYGPQTVLEPDFAHVWAGHLRNMSQEDFALTAQSLQSNLQYLAPYARVTTPQDRDAMAVGAKNLLAAAEQTLTVAKETGSETAIAVAAQAVELARVAHRDAVLGSQYFELTDPTWDAVEPAIQKFVQERLAHSFPELPADRPPPEAGLAAAEPAIFAAGDALVAAGEAVVGARTAATSASGD